MHDIIWITWMNHADMLAGLVLLFLLRREEMGKVQALSHQDHDLNGGTTNRDRNISLIKPRGLGCHPPKDPHRNG